MSVVLIRAALETALAAVSPSLSTAWENAPFTPVQGTPYQRSFLILGEPDDLEMSGAIYWERGVFQVNLYYPLGAGTAAAHTQAMAIREAFYRGNTFTSGGVVTTVRKTPEIGPSFPVEDRYMVPVRVRFSAQITRS